MKKFSRLYRTDTEALDPELRRRLDAVFLPTLQHLEVQNPRLLVVFSGGNATGKSALSRKIGDELFGLVLENDAIKRAVLEHLPDITRPELNTVTWQYSMDLYRRLSALTQNGLVVRDGIIDWYFDRILPVFEQQGYPLFIVQYELTREAAAGLVVARGDTPTVTTEILLTQLEDHAVHQQRFRSTYDADIILTEENMFDHDAVIRQLRLVIEVLRDA